jgi:aminoglycoside phosphotransferase (APT) family kinase protein
MALANTIDPEAAARPLALSVAAHHDASDVVVHEVTIPASSGMSNQTLLFDASWTTPAGSRGRHELVARVHPPPGTGLFMTYDAERERRLMAALAGDSLIPVPRVYFGEQDLSPFGAPFLVMDRVDGRAPADDPPFTVAGWMLDLDPSERATLFDRAIEMLASIHAVDWRSLGLEFLGEGESALGPLDQRLAYEERYYAWAAQGASYPVIDAAFAWIRERDRPQEDLVLNWGDARISNMIFRPDLSVAAVVDWEMASLASCELDLGWWLFGMRHHTEGIGVPLPDGFPSARQFLARYAELTGWTPQDLDFYEVLAGTRAAIMMVRAADMMVAAGFLPPDTPMHHSNPASQLLARLIGVEQPTGETTSFIGNRG